MITLIKQECGQHQKLTVNMPYISGTAMVNYATMPMTVEVGGATIFVINVRSLRKDLTPGIFGKHVCILSKITKSMKKMQNFVKFSLFPLGATYIIMLYAST